MDVIKDEELDVIIRYIDDEFDAILCCTVQMIECYYKLYIHKVPCMNSNHTGYVRLQEILRGNESRCQSAFRMVKHVLQNLCKDLETTYGFKGSRRMCALEILAMTLSILGHGLSNRLVQETFQHSGETISRYFTSTLDVLCMMAVDLIKPSDPAFKHILEEIASDSRYMPRFKVCYC